LRLRLLRRTHTRHRRLALRHNVVGLALTLIHLISIPVTNTSVNPARSTSVAFYADTAAVSQLWLFWVAPLAGAAIGALVWKLLLSDGTD
jgi:aquaporin Z